MSVTRGTLIQRGDKWRWKYRRNGEPQYETLDIEDASKRKAERYRDAKLEKYRRQEGYSFSINRLTVEELCVLF